MRIAVEQGMHTDMPSHYLDEQTTERYRGAWWTVYILDRRMSSLMGTPISISDEDITAVIPTYADFPQKSSALKHHVQLSKATSSILHSASYSEYLQSVFNILTVLA